MLEISGIIILIYLVGVLVNVFLLREINRFMARQDAEKYPNIAAATPMNSYTILWSWWFVLATLIISIFIVTLAVLGYIFGNLGSFLVSSGFFERLDNFIKGS